MIRIERSPDGSIRILGTLETAALATALEAVDGAPARLDCSEVYAADGDAIRLLAGLAPGRVTFVACPPWLEFWIARERQRTGSGTLTADTAT